MSDNTNNDQADNTNNDVADVSMITLQQANLRKKSNIDFTKTSFTDSENEIIKKEVALIKEKYFR